VRILACEKKMMAMMMARIICAFFQIHVILAGIKLLILDEKVY
jgi:hypothetical protein